MSHPVQDSLTQTGSALRHEQVAEVHFRNLDLLRAVAVLCVLASHIALAMGNRALGSLGRFGVVMFFFHTSFVLMQSLERMHRAATGWRLTIAFWIRRAFRIYPLAALAVLITISCHVPTNGFGPYHPASVKAVLSNLALTQNLIYAEPVLGPLWSLPLEVQMYVLLPGAYLFLQRKRVSPVLLWCGSVVLGLTLPHLNDRLEVFRYAPCFTAGIVAFQLEGFKAQRLRAWTWPLSLLAAALLFGPYDDHSLPSKIYLAWLASLLLAIAYVHTQDAKAGLVAEAAHKLAEISYGVYLAHIVVIFLTERFFHPGLLADSFFAISVLVIPMLLYRFVERPFMALGRLLSAALTRTSSHPRNEMKPLVTSA